MSSAGKKPEVYKIVVEVTVLTDREEVAHGSLAGMLTEAEYGSAVGNWEVKECGVLEESKIREELIKLGNDGEFFDV